MANFQINDIFEEYMNYTYENEVHPGISLREYFAGQALIAMAKETLSLNPDVRDFLNETLIARYCVRQADALIKELEE